MQTAPARMPWPALLAVMVVALALHLGLIAGGFHRLSNDEPARILMALDLDWSNALEPWIWPPLHRILLGLALDATGELFWTPRLLNVAAAVAILPVIAAIGLRVAGDARVALLAAVLATAAPARLLLGSVPMADIYQLLFLAAGALGLLAFLQDGRRGTLLAGCACIGLAQMVRYEAFFVGATVGLVLAWRWWRGRMLPGDVAAAGLLLAGFPLFWVANSWAWYGSLSNLGITGQQFVAIHGPDRWLALRWNPLGVPLLQEVARNPVLLLGGAVLLHAARPDRAVRHWALGLFAALPVLAATAVASFGITLAATWRSPGFWMLLLAPFAALGLVRLSAGLAAPRAWAGPALAACVALALLPVALRDARLVRAGQFNWETGHPHHEEAVARAARTALAEADGLAVVDSLSNLDFLQVMVASGMPERFVTSADAPAAEVALDVPMRAALLRAGPAHKTLDDAFDLVDGGAPEALAARRITVAVVREPAFRAALDAAPWAERLGAWPDWAVYRLLVPPRPAPD